MSNERNMEPGKQIEIPFSQDPRARGWVKATDEEIVDGVKQTVKALGGHIRPQQDPSEGTTAITPLVIKDLQDRSDAGKAKYGSVLKSNNGRNALWDAYQEAIDLVQYLRQLIEEEKDKKPMTAREFVAKHGSLFAPLPAVSEESVAQEAHRLVYGNRGSDYGHPIFDMTRSADMLTALLRDKLKPGARLEAEDIGQAMVCVKQSRHRNAAKRDNLTDTAGYALTLQMIKEWRDAHPGEDPRNHF